MREEAEGEVGGNFKLSLICKLDDILNLSTLLNFRLHSTDFVCVNNGKKSTQSFVGIM